MPFDPSETRDLFERECQFPAEHADVVASVGDADIGVPAGEAVAVQTVLERSDQERYESLSALHNTIMANLGEAHIGRKAYDDRSPNPRREDEVSF
ncbi:MAG: hypothetical protein ABEJ89_06235 [Haloarculaceae archaeon]